MRDRDASWLMLVIGVITVEVLVAGPRRLSDAVGVFAGDVTPKSVSGLLGLLWLPVMVVVLALAARRLTRLGRAHRIDVQTIRAATSTSRDWEWTTDPDLVLTHSNDRVHDLLGWEEADVIGRSTRDFLADATDGEHRDYFRMVCRGLREKTGWSDLTTRWRHRDGHVVELTGSASCILGPTGDLVAVRGSRRGVDATAANRAERDCRRAVVRRVLALGDLQIALQPIVDLRSDTTVGLEALSRFADGRSPQTWFSEAAAVGLGADLELLAIRTALDLSRRLPPQSYLSVNASPEVILDPRTAALLRRTPLPLDRMVLEITEHAEISCYDDLCAALTPLRDAGLRLAVDDAGAGYASFQHILKLRPDIIKLDRSLIENIEHDGGRQAFVTAVVLLGLELNASITAEGVETPAELQTVTNLGIDSAQGYLTGRPSLDHANGADHDAHRPATP